MTGVASSPSASSPAQHAEERWNADAFYWSVIDTAGLPRSGRRREEQLGYRLEETLPVDLEAVQTVFIDIGSRRAIGCAVEHERLREASARGAFAVGPETLPAFVAEALPRGRSPASLAAAINLLRGRHEPQAIVAVRRSLRWVASIGLAVALALVAFGGLRRASGLTVAADDVRRASDARIEATLPGGADSALPPSLRLVAEMRRLEQAGAAGSTRRSNDTALELAELLAKWPSGRSLGLDGIAVGAETTTVRWRAPSAGDAQSLVDALGACEGWVADQPQFRSEESGVQASMTLRRVRKGGS